MVAVRRKKVLPEGEPINVKIKEAEEVSGQFCPQIRIDNKVIDGPHQGFEFPDYLKLHTDEDTGETYVQEGGKAWEVLVACFGEAGADDFEDAAELVGEVITARASVRGKAKKMNGLEFGSIGPYIPPKKRKKNQEAIEQEVADDLPDDEMASDENNPLMQDGAGGGGQDKQA